MGRAKFDFVVEAAHYSAGGQLEWVRGFERRGPAFSDRVILQRDDLIGLLKAGKRVLTGRRIPQMAGTFEVGDRIEVRQSNGKEVVVSGAGAESGDHLQGVPQI
jgi:hypothetical protein